MYNTTRLSPPFFLQLTIKSKMPMQMDGEPWEQGASVVNVSYYNQALMLAKQS